VQRPGVVIKRIGDAPAALSNGAVDFVADAVEVAKAAGVPVKVVWTREDDIRHDPYRPGSVNALAATLNADGTIAAYAHTVALSSIAAHGDVANLKDGVDPALVRGTGDMAYTIPNLLVDFHHLDVKIPVGPWRAPYANGNYFPTESFVDELAHAAGKDPVAFRLALLPAGSRARNVLTIAAQRAGWGSAALPGHARGVALTQWDGTWIALIAEISAPAGGLQVHRVWTAVDCGLPVNLDGIETQVSCACATPPRSTSRSCRARRARRAPVRSERRPWHRRSPTPSSHSPESAYGVCRCWKTSPPNPGQASSRRGVEPHQGTDTSAVAREIFSVAVIREPAAVENVRAFGELEREEGVLLDQ
jgi:hypothetical protein